MRGNKHVTLRLFTQNDSETMTVKPGETVQVPKGVRGIEVVKDPGAGPSQHSGGQQQQDEWGGGGLGFNL